LTPEIEEALAAAKSCLKLKTFTARTNKKRRTALQLQRKKGWNRWRLKFGTIAPIARATRTGGKLLNPEKEVNTPERPFRCA
jgi:hypothetical protein